VEEVLCELTECGFAENTETKTVPEPGTVFSQPYAFRKSLKEAKDSALGMAENAAKNGATIQPLMATSQTDTTSDDCTQIRYVDENMYVHYLCVDKSGLKEFKWIYAQCRVDIDFENAKLKKCERRDHNSSYETMKCGEGECDEILDATGVKKELCDLSSHISCD
jgi:hypothetical protein